MNDDSAPEVSDGSNRPRSTTTLLLLALCAALFFSGFVALGCWQIKRLSWKLDLIARVEQRVHAPPAPIPTRQQWQNVSEQSDGYRHVQVSGVFLNQFSTRVAASTIWGRGFWLLTPLQSDDGSVIWINRGFVAFESGANAQSSQTSAHGAGTETITGLLRITEPGGAFMRRNQPDQQHWYSRDIAAMTAATHLNNVAPFFIDADATAIPADCSNGQCIDHPVGGLTVIAFNNNHLVYSITWFALALMVAIACYILARSEIRLQRLSRNSSANSPSS